MDEHDEVDLSEIGAALVEASQLGRGSAREILRELFPYVDEASKRMSTRAISQFLKDNFDVQISPASILRALRAPDRHWEDFAEYIEGEARIVEDATGVPMEVFLFANGAFSCLDEQELSFTAVDEEGTMKEFDEFRNAMQFLREKWFSLPGKAHVKCKRFFVESNQTEEKEE